MFDYKAWLAEIFSTLSVPYSYGFYQGPSPVWVVALMYNAQGSSHADNRELATSYSFQINVYSKNDNATIVQEVEDKIHSAGCTRLYKNDSFDPQTNYLQTTIYFQYEKVVE